MVLVLDATKKIRIVAIDCLQTEAILGPLWLHRWDGARQKLTNGVSQDSAPNLPAVFFEESYSITDGFEMPERISTEAAELLPEKPAKLLPRFKPPAQPIDNQPQSLKPEDFLYQAVLDGLIEDGVSPDLAGSLAKDDERKSRSQNFLAKCPLCYATQHAMTEYLYFPAATSLRKGKDYLKI